MSQTRAAIRLSPIRFLWKRRRPLAFLEEVAGQSPNVASLRVGRQSVTLVTHPEMVQKLLITDAAKIEKGRTAERDLFFSFLGDGLLNARGESHRRQRRLVLPAFHRSRLATYGNSMTEAAIASAANWRDGEIRDVCREMMALALTVLGRTLFSSDVAPITKSITQGFDRLTDNINRLIFPGARWLLRTPLPFARRIHSAKRDLDRAVLELINARRSSERDTGDLLSMLLMAEDAESPGSRLSDVEVRDQILTLLFTGQAPIGTTLSWVWWLLAQHPEQEAALHAEVDSMPADQMPTFDDLPKLVKTERIVRETLRLYPALWSIGRRATEALEYDGHHVPVDSLIVASPWITQRDARWFAEPLVFKPQRWTPDFRASLPRFAYFPFGGGTRTCVAENYAWMELILIVATLAKRWRFEATNQSTSIHPQARITLHPDSPVLLKLRSRR